MFELWFTNKMRYNYTRPQIRNICAFQARALSVDAKERYGTRPWYKEYSRIFGDALLKPELREQVIDRALDRLDATRAFI